MQGDVNPPLPKEYIPPLHDGVDCPTRRISPQTAFRVAHVGGIQPSAVPCIQSNPPAVHDSDFSHQRYQLAVRRVDTSFSGTGFDFHNECVFVAVPRNLREYSNVHEGRFEDSPKCNLCPRVPKVVVPHKPRVEC